MSNLIRAGSSQSTVHQHIWPNILKKETPNTYWSRNMKRRTDILERLLSEIDAIIDGEGVEDGS